MDKKEVLLSILSFALVGMTMGLAKNSLDAGVEVLFGVASGAFLLVALQLPTKAYIPPIAIACAIFDTAVSLSRDNHSIVGYGGVILMAFASLASGISGAQIAIHNLQRKEQLQGFFQGA